MVPELGTDTTGACDFEISQTSSKLPAFFPRKTKCTPANKLSMNIVKTEYMIIGTSQKLMQLGAVSKIKVNNTLLKRVPNTKSFGLIIDETLSWVNHIEYIYQLKLNEALEF